jgi:hypothetical protein
MMSEDEEDEERRQMMSEVVLLKRRFLKQGTPFVSGGVHRWEDVTTVDFNPDHFKYIIQIRTTTSNSWQEFVGKKDNVE